MKYTVLTTILLLFFSSYLIAQGEDEKLNVQSGKEALEAGKKAEAEQNLDKALNYYFAAEAYEPNKRTEIRIKVNEVFKLIQDQKQEAEDAKKRALQAQEEAEKARDEAIAAKERAEKAEEKAKKAEQSAIEQTKLTEKARKTERLARIVADSATAKAKKAQMEAEQAQREAEEQKKIAVLEKNKAEQLQVEALSTATALKSISMEFDYEDTLKSLLAIEAYNMQMTMLYDTLKEAKQWLSSEIYTCLHDALAKIKGKDYEEYTKEENGHSGPVRSIIQTDTNRIYTLGSDGKLLRWDIKKWENNGKPEANLVTLREEESIDITAAIREKVEKNKDWIAIGGRFSPVSFIKQKKNILKETHRSTKAKKSNYTINTYQKYGLEEVYQLAFQDEYLYALKKDGIFTVYNTETNETQTLTLPKVGKKMTIHPNKKIIAVGKSDGIYLLKVDSSNTISLDTISLGGSKLDNREISALKFDDEGEILAVGTNDGYIGLIHSMNDFSTVDSIKIRKFHSLLVSAIDFRTYEHQDSLNTKNKILAVGNYDGTVSVWLLNRFDNNQYEPFVLDNTDAWVTSLSFIKTKQEHNQLMVGYFDGTIKFWNLDIETMANGLKCIIKNDFEEHATLTDTEKKQFYLNLKIEFLPYAKCE